jgi:murein DD-endopeptidase MepM/ murein hydrolase activator NlpD
MRWRTVLAIVGLSFASGALTDVALRARLDVRAAAARSYMRSAAPETGPSGPGAGPADAAPHAGSDDGTSVATTGVVNESAIDVLRRRGLAVPVEGVRRSDLRDTFTDAREGGAHAHEAIDIMAPRRTPVRAVEDGTIQKLFTSKAGGLTIYEFEPSGTFCYYYAHLDGYAEGLHEGQAVHKGDLIGYVGSTGNASPDAPHLHFSIFRLTPERQWWKGEPIDPYPALR